MSCKDIKTPNSPNMRNISRAHLRRIKSGLIEPNVDLNVITYNGGADTSQSELTAPKYNQGKQTNSDNTTRLIKPSTSSSATADVDRALSVKGTDSSGNGISSAGAVNVTGSNSAGRSIISAGAVDVNGQDSNGNSINTTGAVSAAGAITAGGQIESTSGGIKFPDATVQTTAATGGGSSVFFRISDASSGVNGTTGGLLNPTGGTIEDPNGGYSTGTGAAVYTLSSTGIYLAGASTNASVPTLPIDVNNLSQIKLTVQFLHPPFFFNSQGAIVEGSVSYQSVSGAFIVSNLPQKFVWSLFVTAPFPKPNMSVSHTTLWVIKISDL